MVDFSIIGKEVPRIDALDKATGQALYAGDFKLPGMLFGKLLLSPHPHAKILNINTEKAERLPGVKAVITAKDVPDVKYGVSPARYDENILAIDRVRYIGDEVAAVAAVDEETAVEAVGLIEVEYEPLPAVFDPFEATAEGAPQLHERTVRNINAEVHQHFGDVEKGFAESDHIREDKFVTHRTYQSPIEPHAVLATFDLDGRLTVWTSTQVPHYVQYQLSRVLGIPMGKIRVIKPHMGGGFGGKAETTPLEFCAAILSQRTGRPVQMLYDRDEMFKHGRGRHKYYIELKTGVKRDGTLLACHARTILEGGAYTSYGIATVYYAGAMLTTPYRLPNLKIDSYLVYTNKPACGAQRGHGVPQPRFAFESQMDMIAEDLGIDPVEIRLRNALRPYEMTVNEFQITTCQFEECLRRAAELSGWWEKRGKLPKGKGIGIAGGCFISGPGYPIYRTEMPHSSAMIKVSEDGTSVTLYSGAADIGQGSDTALAMIAAEELGVRFEDVKVVSADTEMTPLDLGAYGSRQTFMSGNAVKEAALQVKNQLLEVASEKLEANIDDLEAREGRIYVKGSPDRAVTFAEAAREAFVKKGPVVGKGAYKPPKLGGSYKGAPIGTSPAYSFCAQVAEVSVDLETGEVTLERMTNVHDSGTVINPAMFHGQVEGSVVMGMGEALLEEVIFDDGKIINPNLAEYRIPTAVDAPEIISTAVESHDPAGPFGAKEVGEGSALPIFGAIANAVYDATGVRIKDLPIKSEKIIAALRGG